MKVVAFTGHRPAGLADHLGLARKHAYSSKLKDILIDVCHRAITHTDATRVISGGALGVDQAAAQAALDLGLELFLYLPFDGFDSRWPAESQRELDRLITKATASHYVCEPGYDAAKMQRRNEAMVDEADQLISFWSGLPSGTANCVHYARKQGVPVLACWKALQAAVAKETW